MRFLVSEISLNCDTRVGFGACEGVRVGFLGVENQPFRGQEVWDQASKVESFYLRRQQALPRRIARFVYEDFRI